MPKIVRQDHVSHHKNAAQQYLLQYFWDPEALQLRDQPWVQLPILQQHRFDDPQN